MIYKILGMEQFNSGYYHNADVPLENNAEVFVSDRGLNGAGARIRKR
jgi:hypothetical protein